MFSAFHHFRPDAARAILKDAFDRRRAICIFEAGSGTLLAATTMLGVPLAVLALMPFS
jgi:ribose 5-phosphate isomerase RpiB